MSSSFLQYLIYAVETQKVLHIIKVMSTFRVDHEVLNLAIKIKGENLF